MIALGHMSYGEPIIRGDISNVNVGKFCSIAQDVVLDCGMDHRIDYISTFPFCAFYKEAKHLKGHPRSKGDITIMNDVWIGEGAMILAGVTIGNGAVIAARAVVTKDVGNYEVVGGVPAKHIKYRFSPSMIDQLLLIQWWNKDDNWIKENAHILMSDNITELFKNSK